MTQQDHVGEPQGGKFSRVSSETLSDAIVQQIVHLISTDALKAGDRLPPERSLCKTLGVGRTSVREALKPLLAMGILERRGNSGTFVAEGGLFLKKTLEWGLKFDPKQVEDLIETRVMLETNTAYWAASRATAENLAELERHQAGMRASIDDPDAFRDFDIKFHLEIAQATQNSVLISLVNMMRQYFLAWIQERLSAGPIDTADLAWVSLFQHQAILDQLQAGDSAGARDAMAVHIDTASADLRTYLNSNGPQST
jgi:GntR family transcriptional repressor for pyruvate dehydrogenase complex